MGAGDELAPTFTAKPVLRQEDGGSKLVFESTLKAFPKPELFWFKGDEELIDGGRLKFGIEDQGSNSYRLSLTISDVVAEDGGSYRVNAKNPLGEVSANINLNFGAEVEQKKAEGGLAPSFAVKPVIKQLDGGKKLRFECKVNANPAPIVNWFREGSKIVEGGRYETFINVTGNLFVVALEITNVAMEDAGKYRVTCKNEFGESNANIGLNFDAEASKATKVIVIRQRPVIRVLKKKKIVIELVFSAPEEPDIELFHAGSALPFKGRHSCQCKKEGDDFKVSLGIDEISKSDEGDYKILLKHVGGEHAEVVNFSLADHPDLDGEKPKEKPPLIAKHLEDASCKVNETVSFVVEFEGSAPAEVNWFRNNVKISNSDGLEVKTSGLSSSLTLSNCQPGDAGAFHVEALNAAGKTESRATLSVESESTVEGGSDFREQLKQTTKKETSVTSKKSEQPPKMDKIEELEAAKKKKDKKDSDSGGTLKFQLKKTKRPDKGPKDRWDTPLVNIDAHEDDGKLKLTCQFWKPNVQSRWYKDKEELFIGFKYRMGMDQKDHYLTISKLNGDDTGHYECIANNVSTGADIYVEPAAPKYLFTKELNKDYHAFKKKTVIMECFVNDEEAPHEWHKEKTKIDLEEATRKQEHEWAYQVEAYKNPRMKIIHEFTRMYIKIEKLQEGDQGRYDCILEGGQTTFCHLYVDDPQYKFIKRLENCEVTEKDKMVLEVEMEDEDADVTWYRNDAIIDPKIESEFEEVIDGKFRRLVCNSVQMKHKGMYRAQCAALSSSGRVAVNRCFEIVQPLVDLSGLEESEKPQTVKMVLELSRDDRGSVKWFKNGEQIFSEEGSPPPRFSCDQDGCKYILTIKNIKIADTGTYKAEIEKLSSSCQFTVTACEKAPRIDMDKIPKEIKVDAGEVIDFNIPCIALPPPKVKLLIDGEEEDTFKLRMGKIGPPKAAADMEKVNLKVVKAARGHTGKYEIVVENVRGSVKIPIKITVVDKPEAPKGPLELTDIFADHTTVNWKPPEDDGGAPIEGYIVEKMDMTRGTWVQMHDLHGDYHKNQKVQTTKGKEYKFRVCAYNRMGKGPWLETKNTSLAKNPYDAPGAPGKPTITDWDYDHVELEWKPPLKDGGAPITQYIVEKWWKKDPQGENWVQVTTCKSTTARVDKVTEGKDYEFRVRAVNAEGPGEPSEPSAPLKIKHRFVAPKIDFKSMKPIKVKAGQKLKIKVPIKGAPPPEVAWSKGGVVLKPAPKRRPPTKEEEAEMIKLKGFTKKLKKTGLAENGGGKDGDGTGVDGVGRGGISDLEAFERGSGLSKRDKTQLDEYGRPIGDGTGADGRGDGDGYDRGSGEPDADGKKGGWKKGKGKLPDAENELEKVTLKKVPGKKIGPDDEMLVEDHKLRPVGDQPRILVGRHDVDDENCFAELEIPISERGDTGKFTLHVKNGTGEDKMDIQVDVLDKPTAPEGPLEVSDIKKDSARLKWKPPLDDGGSPVTGYVVQKKAVSGGDWVSVPTEIKGTEFLVNRLKEGERYEFRVMAENAIGTSPALDTGGLAFLAKNPYDAPGAPPPPGIKEHDRDHITVEIKPPANNGGAPITGYTIERKEKGSNRWIPVNKEPISSTSYTDDTIGKRADDYYKDDTVVEKKEYQYRVIAHNKAGPGKPSEPSTHVRAIPMNEAPSFLFDPKLLTKEIRVRAGDPMEVKLPVSGQPPPECIWELNGATPEEAITDATEDQVSFLIKKAKRDMSGKLNVKLKNRNGEDEVEFKVVVYDKPSPPIGPLEVLETTNDSVTLQWKPPKDDGGSPIDGYIVEYQVEGSDEWVQGPRVATSCKHKVKGLPTGERVKFRISAENVYGVSTPITGPPHGVVVKYPFDPPMAPGVPEILEYHETNMILEWEKPKHDGGNPIQGYMVEKKERNSEEWVKALNTPVKDTTANVQNLTEGQYYEFRVVAFNTAGPSEPSGPSKMQRAEKPVFPPPAPGAIAVDEITKDHVDLSWKKPMDDGGSKLTGFVIEAAGPDGVWKEVKHCGPNTTSARIPVEEGEQLQFRVRAENERGAGEPSRPTDMITCVDQPCRPSMDLSELKNITVKAPDAIKLKVPYKGVEKPTATWSIGEEVLVHDGELINCVMTDDAIELVVQPSSRKFHGEFTLTLKNSLGTAVGHAKVTVLAPPAHPQGPLEAENIDATSIKLAWKPPVDDGGDKVTNYVVLKREKGKKSWSKAAPYVGADEQDFIVKNLVEGKEYEFQVVAENAYGLSEPLETDKPIVAKPPYDAPGKCSPPKCKGTTEDSITLTWDPPKDDGGNPVSGYVVEKKEKGTDKWIKVPIDVKDNEVTVPGLVEGKEYEFRVSAVNAAGVGEPSDSSGAIEAVPAPSAPKIGDGFVLGNIVVLAGEPFVLKIPYSGYPPPTAAWTNNGVKVDTSDRVTSIVDRNYVILSVKSAVMADAGSYCVTLTNPSGADSLTANVRVVDKPGPPQGPIVPSDQTPDSMVLTWKPPKEEGGAPVTNYIVEMKDEAVGVWKKVTNFARYPRAEVYNLTPDHKYSFRVFAENIYGTGEPLETEEAIVAGYAFNPPGAPSTPRILKNEPSGVELAWGKPHDDGGGKIQGYQVEMKEVGTQNWVPANDAITRENHFTVDRMKPNTDYEFRVKAKNLAGFGDPSPSTSPVKLKAKVTKPSTPGIPQVQDIGKDWIKLEWSPPIKTGGAEVAGYIVEKRDTATGMWIRCNQEPIATNEAKIKDLTENGEYEFRVRAVNEAGESDPSMCTHPIKIKPKIVGDFPVFSVPLKKVKAPVGKEAVFVCKVKGEPPVEQVKWLWSGQQIHVTGGGRTKIESKGETQKLTITEVWAGDHNVRITCEATNLVGAASTAARLKVQGPPYFSKPIGDKSVDLGETLSVKIAPEGVGPFTFEVLKDGQPLAKSDRITVNDFEDFAMLQIADAQRADGGKYSIVITNDSGSTTVDFNTAVVAVPGEVSDVKAVETTNESIKLAWTPPRETGGKPITHYVIEKMDVTSGLAAATWTVASANCRNAEFTAAGLTEGNDYYFRVSACNEVGASEPVKTKDAIKAVYPFDKPDSPSNLKGTEIGGDFVTLSWDAPKSDGGGRIDGYLIEKREVGTDDWMPASRGQLVKCTMANVTHLKEDHDYEFRVIAVNPAGNSAPCVIDRAITVRDPNAKHLPKFIKGLENQCVVEGKSATFTVEVSGNPRPNVSWFKGARELYSSNKHTITKSGNIHTLVLHDVYGEDADEYSARATNTGGSRSSMCLLEIEGPPKIKVPPRFQELTSYERGETVSLKIPFIGHPTPTSKWTLDGRDISKSEHLDFVVSGRHAILAIKGATMADSGPWKLRLENKFGADEAVIKIAVNDRPDAPRTPIVENVKDTSAYIRWAAPNDNGGFITHYVVEKFETANPEAGWVKAGTTRFPYINLQSLKADSEYQFRIIAENFYGQSIASEPTAPVRTKKKEIILEAPKKKAWMEDEDGRKIRGRGPKQNDYDKLYWNIDEKVQRKKCQVKYNSVYDEYDILEEIGVGAFGVVHRAVEKKTGRSFAAKFVPIHHASERNMIKNEISIMNELHNPKLLYLHDAFEEIKIDDEMVLIMEFLSGGELFDRITDDSFKMTEEEARNYMRQICQALKSIHDQCIVHLDLKPENILFESSKSSNLKLIDFGLAAKLDPEVVAKVSIATAEFAAPEIVNRDAVGYFTDMWAVGVLTYILLSGLSPFAGNTDNETLKNVKRCEWAFDPAAFRHISAEGKDFISRLLIGEKERRMNVYQALEHPWLTQAGICSTERIPPSNYYKFRDRLLLRFDNYPKSFPAIGRMANNSSLKKLRPKEYKIFDSFFDKREAAPRFVVKPQSLIVIEGTEARFECRIVSPTSPVLTWEKDGNEVKISHRHFKQYSGNNFTLVIKRTKINEDAGEYIATATNSYGSTSEIGFLNVEPQRQQMSRLFSKEATPIRDRKIAESQRKVDEPDSPPMFTFLLRPRFVQEGQAVKLLACLNAKPTPKITWLKDGKALPLTLRLCENYYYGVATLEIVGVEKDDEGVYTCVAENELGTARTECLLSVEAKSYIPAKPQGLLILESKLLDRSVSSNYEAYFSSQTYSSFTNSAVTALSRQTSRVAPPQPTPQAERAAVGLPPSGRAARQAISTNLMKTSSASGTTSSLVQRSSSTRVEETQESVSR